MPSISTGLPQLALCAPLHPVLYRLIEFRLGGELSVLTVFSFADMANCVDPKKCQPERRLAIESFATAENAGWPSQAQMFRQYTPTINSNRGRVRQQFEGIGRTTNRTVYAYPERFVFLHRLAFKT